MRELMVRDAIREALDEEMARDNTVFQMGEDIGVIGGNFKCTVGLRDKYGDLRVKDTPISEQGFVGMGVGAALTGLRPVVELMFADFMMVCGDQLFNQMAKITYMSGGQCNVPMVVRSCYETRFIPYNQSRDLFRKLSKVEQLIFYGRLRSRAKQSDRNERNGNDSRYSKNYWFFDHDSFSCDQWPSLC